MTTHSKGVPAIVALSFGFAAIAVATRYLGGYFTLWQQLYLTLGIASVVSFLIFPHTLKLERLKGIPARDWIIMISRVIGGYAIGAALFRESLLITKISNVEFIQSIPFEAIFGWVLFRENFTFRRLFWITLAFTGVVLISVQEYSSLFVLGKGEMFSLISAAIFSFGFLSRKWQSNYLNNKEITQILLLLATFVLFAISILKGEGLPVLTVGSVVLVTLLFVGAFNAINIFFINYGFEHVKAVLASNVLALEAVFALTLAAIFYKEIPNLRESLGGLLVLWSVFQMNQLSKEVVT